jgi:hypothetical protein
LVVCDIGVTIVVSSVIAATEKSPEYVVISVRCRLRSTRQSTHPRQP